MVNSLWFSFTYWECYYLTKDLKIKSFGSDSYVVERNINSFKYELKIITMARLSL